MTQSKKMARIAYDALNEKKGEDIKIIDIAEVSTLGDYFVIANGNSSSQVTALVDNVEEETVSYTHLTLPTILRV